MEKLSSIPNSVGEVSIAGIKGEIAGYVTTAIITPAMKEGNQYLNTNPNNLKHANACDIKCRKWQIYTIYIQPQQWPSKMNIYIV